MQAKTELNTYKFRLVLESMADESLTENTMEIKDFTPHEAWTTLHRMLSQFPEHDCVVLSITLV